MANTGVTTFAGMATALEANHPNTFSRSTIELLKKLDSLAPYIYDACAAYMVDPLYSDVLNLIYTSSIMGKFLDNK